MYSNPQKDGKVKSNPEIAMNYLRIFIHSFRGLQESVKMCQRCDSKCSDHPKRRSHIESPACESFGIFALYFIFGKMMSIPGR